MRLSWPTLDIDRLCWLLGQHSSLHIVMVRELYVQSSDETWMTDLLTVPEAAIQDTKDRIASEIKADKHRREHSIENIVACELADNTRRLQLLTDASENECFLEELLKCHRDPKSGEGVCVLITLSTRDVHVICVICQVPTF